MQIFIMRHGEAQNFVGQGCVDSQRTLTQQGEQEAQIMATWLQKRDVKPLQVFVSPYIRAQQTCAIATSSMNSAVTTLDFITPSGDAKQVHDFIDGWCSEQQTLNAEKNKQHQQSLFIVAHMPLVSYLVAELTQFEHAPIFSTAGIAEIEYDVDRMQGQLKGLVSPLDLC